MKFFLDNWTLIAVAFAAGAMLVWPAVTRGAQGGTLSPSAAVMLMNREKAVVVDVCEADEFAAGHVVGARNIPLGQLEERLASEVKNRDNPLILVCATGARSGRAVAIAKKLGYEKAQSMAGGLGAWKSANLPLEKS